MMANGMFDLKGWHIATPEEIAQREIDTKREQEEFDRRWPPSQRRPRCLACGAFVAKNSDRWTKCTCCGESDESLQ